MTLKFLDNFFNKGITQCLQSGHNVIKREIYDKLSRLTGRKPEWGILTGIRPVKLYGEMAGTIGTEQAVSKLKTDYYISDA